MGGLYETLISYDEQGVYPFHMPGHKRQTAELGNPYKIDITEIDGFDDLHKPEGLIKNTIDAVRDLYGCDEAFITVNGSTSCILAAISAAVEPGGSILLVRNCHKSAYNAIFLKGLKPVYLYPKMDPETGISLAVTAMEVEALLQAHPEIKAVFLTSPTFEGVVSDIKSIAKVVHTYGAALIVDAAHGAHLGLSDYFPSNPLQEGADVVIMSIHKTLPALTQTAVMGINGSRIPAERVKKYLDIYVSSSPSYVLMASVDQCISLMTKEGDRLLADYAHRIQRFREACSGLKQLYFFESGHAYDQGKIVICTNRASIGGVELTNILRRQYKLEMEMQSREYVIAMTSVSDSEEGMNRLAQALLEIDDTLQSAEKKPVGEVLIPQYAMSSAEADRYEKKTVFFSESDGEISAETLYVYPPGIPILVPGEIIDQRIIALMLEYKEAGLNVCGLSDEECLKIQVLDR